MAEGLTWAPAWRLRDLIGAKEVSPVEVAEHFLARIEEFDSLQAFIHVEPERVRHQASTAEAAILAREDLGPLHGVPMAVKSHIDIEGFPRVGALTTPGVARRDHLVVERLRAAGATIVGHNTMPTLTETGAVDVDALARNPWDPTRMAGVSSAGGGASVAAGLLPVVLGTDGGGSIRCPSAYNGLVGMHPTVGWVPTVVDNRPQAVEFGVGGGVSIGPIARDVRDAATVLSVIAGPDGRAPMSLGVDLPDPLGELDNDATGLRLAWTDDLGFVSPYAFDESPKVISRVREAALAVSGIGATVEETTEKWEDPVAAIAVYQALAVPAMRASVSDEDFDAAMELRQRNWLRFRNLFAHYDLLLSPAMHSVAPVLDVFRQWTSAVSVGSAEYGRIPAMAAYLTMFNWLEFPAAAVGCGFVDGLPVGLQIVGPPGSDRKILRLARAIRNSFPQNDRPELS